MEYEVSVPSPFDPQSVIGGFSLQGSKTSDRSSWRPKPKAVRSQNQTGHDSRIGTADIRMPFGKQPPPTPRCRPENGSSAATSKPE